MNDIVELLKELTEAPGVPGYEGEVREIIRKHLSDITTIETDKVGRLCSNGDGNLWKKRTVHIRCSPPGIDDQLRKSIDLL